MDEDLYVSKEYPIHEEPIYNLNPCHALECYYSNETWLRTQTVTAPTRISHWIGERIPRKLETANHTRCILEDLPWPCWKNGTAMICQNWQNGKEPPTNSKKSKKVKSQKTEQDSLLNVALHSESGFLYFHDSVLYLCYWNGTSVWQHQNRLCSDKMDVG